MKKMSATILSVALAGSLAVVPASAIAMGGGMGAARAAVRAGMEQTLASPNDRAAIEVVDQAGSQAAGHAGNQPANQMPVQDAGRLEINEPGTYVLTGNLRGTVDVNPGAGDVRLVLDNATIDGNGGPAIRAKSGDSLTISLPEGSFNRVMSSGMGQDCRGTIFGDVNMRFEGPGALTVVGNNQPGIFANDARMTFGGGDFTFIGGGFGMQAGGNAPGNVVVNGGAFSSQPGMEMVAPGTNVMQNGGSFGQRETVPFSGYNDYMQQNPWTSNPQDVPQQGGMQQPDAQQPGMQQPGAQQPGALQPGAQQSGVQQGGVQQPNGQQPGAQQPGAQQPGIPQEGTQQAPSQPSQQASGQNPGQGQIGQPTQIITGTSTTASEIVTSDVANTAAKLYEDLANAINYLMTNENSQVKISDAGTYVISGSATDGNITVKKGTTGVVLVLEDLDLTSTTGATLSVNKNAEVKIVVSGNVTLTDNENPADEESTDEAVADAYDGAAIKVKAGSQVYLTGDGTLTLNGNAKNGIKVGDEANLVIDGTTLNVTAANDGINANHDLTILSGDITIAAEDDAIHADRILTIGDEETGEGPSIDVTKSTEGLEGTVVNIFGGDIDINSSDDAINAANADAAYEDELDYAINMTGGDVTINSRGDGMDSNGDVNLVDGSASIHSTSGGGEAGIDYDGDLYISNEFELNNASGVAGADMQPGQMGQPGQPGQPGQMGR